MTLGLLTYRAVTGFAAPFLPMLLKGRVKKGKEDANRLQEREGFATRKRPDGPLIWLHGASIGESQLLLLLYKAIRAQRPDISAVITTQTLTSAGMIGKTAPVGLIHQMAPLDTPFAAKRFLDHWQPDLAIFAESDIWPNLLSGLDKRRIPRMLINARMTQKSLKGWQRWRGAAKTVLGGFNPIYAANQATADGLHELLRRRIKMAGNLKYAAPELPADISELTKLKGIISGRPVLAALSTHNGDEALALEAAGRLEAELGQKPLLIIAPRHPERAGEIRQGLPDTGVWQRSKAGLPSPDDTIWLCDTLGEMGLWIRLADVVYLGGGRTGSGVFGHNPIEPLKLGKFVLSLPEVSNFQQEFADLVEAGAASLVTNAQTLAEAALPFLKRTVDYATDRKLVQPYLNGEAPLLLTRDAALAALKKGRKR